MFDIEIDPFNSEHAIFTTGFGGWETFNLSAVERRNEKVKWQIMSTGIEETVPLELYCPPSGAHLLTGVGDYGGFTYYDLTKPVETGANHDPSFGNTDGVCGAWHKPQLMLRCGNIFNHLTKDAPISYSEDGGNTWLACKNVPGDVKAGEKGEPEHGHVAMSAEGTTWVWTPEHQFPAYTTDKGETWTQCQGLPKNIKVIADKENDLLFYAVDVRKSVLYISKDAARTFQEYKLSLNLKNHSVDARTRENRGDIRGGQDRVYSIPAHSGQLWLAAYDGLYFLDLTSVLSSSETKIDMMQKSHVRLIIGFGIGKAAEGNNYPSLYLIGIVNGQYGIFRSVDNAQSWLRINDDEHQFGKLLHIAGDMQDFGRVYIGTHGRGTIMGVEQ
ncbi:MAG: sialidase family protein [Prevotellaceae bacterium]|nr:sialidase family protein [Prevotellaceae bacterium]